MRRRLSELTPEQWKDFEEALALFRADDASAKVPDRGYLAFAVRHGNPMPVRKRLANVPQQDAPADCMCNHSTGDVSANPADLSQPLFLLWHRAYIHAFELSLRFIMRDELAPLRAQRKLPVPDWQHFRLPYWDWSSEDPNIRKQELAAICEHFIAKGVLPSSRSIFGAPPNLASVDPGIVFQNPFYDHLRNPEIFGSAACPSDLFPLEEAENPMIAAPAEPFTVFNKRFLDGWHQTVHQRVGGGGQTMGSTEYASQDPLFWVHHANVDRLWMVWVAGRQAEGEAAPVPDLSAAWRARPVVFPVRANGKAYGYWPDYASLAVNAPDAALGYRYGAYDFFPNGTNAKREIAKP